MRLELKSLIEMIEEDSHQQEGIVTALGLILEHSTLLDISDSNMFADIPIDVSQPLSEDEQSELIIDLSNLIGKIPSIDANLYWAIGKGTPKLAITPLITSIIESVDVNRFDDETAYQALIALENCLASEEEIENLGIFGLINAQLSANFFNNFINPDNPRLSEIARRLQSKCY